MELFGYELTLRRKALRPLAYDGGWVPIVHEPYTGAWQANADLSVPSALRSTAVWSCVTRIASDIAKIAPPLLLERGPANIWAEVTNPAYTPVLRRPNRYQTAPQFYEQWVLSKLLHGNTYVFKERDQRGVVSALYLLDPLRVRVLVAPDGSVYYQLHASDLAGISDDVAVPAREIIHDRWNCAFHPLQGLSPLYAAGGVAASGSAIQADILSRFTKGGRPTGMLIAPTDIDPQSAERIKEKWRTMPPGEILVATHGMKWEQVGVSAVDAQVAETLGLSEETVASCFGMPISIINSAKQPPYANAEASQLQYKAQALQPHFTSIAFGLDEGLELPLYLQTDFDYDALIWMDTATKVAAARDYVGAGVMAPNEARRIYADLPPVKGGDKPFKQMQDIPIDEQPAPALPAREPAPDEEEEEEPA